jgi:hypothetical protein
MKKGMNRRAEEGGGATLGTIITVLLLVLLLVVVVWSFTSSGKEFWAKTGAYKGGTTLDATIVGCNIAASSGATDSFCSELKSVTVGGKEQYMTCSYLALHDGDGKINGALECPAQGNNVLLSRNCAALGKKGVMINDKLISDRAENVTQTCKSFFGEY